MKLIEALREADRRGFPQIKHFYFEPNTSKWSGEVPPSCALGGALMAAGMIHVELNNNMESVADSSMPEEWRMGGVQCELCGEADYHDSNDSFIPHLNDDHGLTRTEIADYLEARGFNL